MAGDSPKGRIDRRRVDRRRVDALLAGVGPPSVRLILADALGGEIPANVGLARLLLAVERVERAERLVLDLLDETRAEQEAEGRLELEAPLSEMARLLSEYREGCEATAWMLRNHPDSEAGGGHPEETIDLFRRFFDRMVRRNEPASVAACSLGDPEILAEATRETVALFAAWGLLDAGRRALEVGCGIGRFLAELAPHLAEIHGVDIAPGMVEASRRRSAGLPNVRVSLGSGRDLADFPDAGFDLVLAIDSFPYIHQGGPELVEAWFREVARVLRPGGDFVVVNFSYRDDSAADRAEAGALADAYGLRVEAAGVAPFRTWDGEVYHFRRRAPGREAIRGAPPRRIPGRLR
jgi:SAM-dependent methyltransferase